MRLLVARPKAPLHGEIVIPPSKYHAHRALMLAALAPGHSTISARTTARHVNFSVSALRALGADIHSAGTAWEVNGAEGFSPRTDEISVGSSGTTLYFLVGLAALADRPIRIVGQRYFRRRPLGPLRRALQRLGVKIEYEGQSLPVTVFPGRPRGGSIRIDGTLSQWVSGLLLVAPFAREATTIEITGELNERPFLELTLEMMRQFGLRVVVREDWRQFWIEPERTWHTSSGRSQVTFRSPVPIHGHPERSVLDELCGVGVPMRFSDDGMTISIDHDGTPPVAGRLDCRDLPDMVPILSTLASRARGRTVLSHVSHVRLKESDRVASMLQLRKMGARVEFDGNDMEFEGVDRLHGAEPSSR